MTTISKVIKIPGPIKRTTLLHSRSDKKWAIDVRAINRRRCTEKKASPAEQRSYRAARGTRVFCRARSIARPSIPCLS